MREEHGSTKSSSNKRILIDNKLLTKENERQIAVTSLPEIDFQRIRPYGNPAARSNAFEEVASIIIKQRPEWPSGTQFNRFGNPDGGREGRGVLPNGDVWAWQAKYLFKFDSSSVSQIKASIIRTLETEPSLKKYFVAMPIDLPAGDTANRKSAFTLWGEEVEKWKKAADEKGMSVEFNFIGAHELATSLTNNSNAGRAKYWFNASVMADVQQQNRVEEITAKLGRRYSPKLHVDVEVAQAIEAVGRTSRFAERWKVVLGKLRSSRQWAWHAPEKESLLYESSLLECNNSLAEVDKALQAVVDVAERFDPMPETSDKITAGLGSLRVLNNLLHVHHREDGGYYSGHAAMLYTNVKDATTALEEAEQLATGIATQASNAGKLLLTGRAGVGKSHLLCDMARSRINSGLPTLMVLGQDFDQRSLLVQLPDLVEMDGSVDGLLSILNAAAEASGHKAMLIIDAINESENPERWSDAIRVLLSKISRFPLVTLVISCRTEFVEFVVGSIDMPTLEHYGFGEATASAVERFVKEYKLDPPTFPIFNSEFGNPLYLRLSCEAAATLDSGRFTLESSGVSLIVNSFVEAANWNLSRANRCDYDHRKNLVSVAIREISTLGPGGFARDEVAKMMEVLLPDRTWSKSLLKGMLDEGILIEAGIDRVNFGYQRLGDMARAERIASNEVPEIKEWLHSLKENYWRELGTLSALAVIVPETYGVELIDLMRDDGDISADGVDAFLESLTLRQPSSVGARAIELVEKCLISKDDAYQAWGQLIRLSCVPNHPLNARWLHLFLEKMELAERDLDWSMWLVGSLETERKSSVRILVEWAWATNEDATFVPSGEAIELATLALGWLLTTSDRRVRDRATKALIAIGEKGLEDFIKSFELLLRVNDPYVVERSIGAACGISLRTCSPSGAISLAHAIDKFVAGGWPSHLLIRDYARRILAVAGEAGWDGPDGKPPYGAEWPVNPTSRNEIQNIVAAPDCRMGTVWQSINEMGDFGRYVIEPAVRKFDVSLNGEVVDMVRRFIFDRVLDLGGDRKKLDVADKSMRRGFREGPVERISKKYQWIAFYEALGLLADNLPINEPSRSNSPNDYMYAEQLIWRDIDVSLITSGVFSKSDLVEDAWFSPKMVEFPNSSGDESLLDVSCIPDPIDSIVLTDRTGKRWLGLLSSRDWKEALSPEVAALRPSTRLIWMHLDSYLVPIDAVEEWKSWAAGKDWHGKWMPRYPEPANLLLGGHHSDPQWSVADGDVDPWEYNQSKGIPKGLLFSGAWYAGTGSSRDWSTDAEVLGFVPSRVLCNSLNLQHGVDFSWRDDEGVAVFDPSTVLGGEEALLLRRDLGNKLAESGFTIFWTALLGYERRSEGPQSLGRNIRWVSASSSYILDGDAVVKIDSRAKYLSSDPAEEVDLEWAIRARDE